MTGLGLWKFWVDEKAGLVRWGRTDSDARLGEPSVFGQIPFKRFTKIARLYGVDCLDAPEDVAEFAKIVEGESDVFVTMDEKEKPEEVLSGSEYAGLSRETVTAMCNRIHDVRTRRLVDERI